MTAPLTREHLSETIWADPVHTVAAPYNISDVGARRDTRAQVGW